MRNMILAALALSLTACAHSKPAGSSDHDCGSECAGHGDKHGADKADAKEGHPGHMEGSVEDHVGMLFTKMDANTDDALTREEIGEHHLAAKFDMADADSDGQISRDEMIAFGTKMHSKMGAKEEATADDAADATADEAAPEAADAAPAEEAAAPEAG